MRQRPKLPRLHLLAALLLLLLLPSVAAPARAAEPGTPTASQPKPLREREVAADAPTISFIDSPSPTCYREDPSSNLCYIEWTYLYVTAGSGQYMLEMTVEIDGRLRANFAGFFQTYMYVPSDMYAQALIVSCGPRGGGGDPNRGNAYAYAVRAKETGGLTTANYGTVTCPFAIPLFSDGFESGAATAWSARRP